MANEQKMPSAIEELSTLITLAGLTHDIFKSILAILDKHETQIYACREDLKLARASAASADRRCAEALYKMADIQKAVKKNGGA